MGRPVFRAKLPQRSHLRRGLPPSGAHRHYNAGMSEGAASPQRNSRQPLSWGGRLGAGAGTAWRLVRGKPGRNKKLLTGLQAGIGGFAKPLRGVMHVLLLQLTGVVFLLLSLSLGAASLHEYRQYQMHVEGWQRAALAGLLGAMFLYFAVTSFWRARKKR